MIPSMKPMIHLLVLAALLITVTPAIFSGEQQPLSDAERGEHLTVKVMTLGQGDPVYVWFGHIALIVDDGITGRSIMFDYGVFDFEQENFYTNFAMGRLYYRVMASYAQQRITYALDERRNTSMITLDLSPAQRYRIYAFLLDNVRPENSTYLYHHYRDNCSTKIRDVIDMAVDGQFQQWADQVPSPYTYREHIRRYTGGHLLMDFVLNFLQSGRIDQQISLWDEMFLPDRLEDALMSFSYIDRSGSQIPIVASREVLGTFDERPAVPDVWQPHWPAALLLGSAVGLLGMFLHLKLWIHGLDPTRTRRHILAGLFDLIMGLIGGTLGSVLLFMLCFTDHDVTFGNTNVLLLHPLLLLLIPLGIMLMNGSTRALALIDIVWGVSALSGILLIILKIFAIITQHNQLSAALIIPLLVSMGLPPMAIAIRARHHKEQQNEP